MHTSDWLQLALFIGLLALITKPIGIYLTKVLDPQGKTWLDPLIRPFEKVTYRLMGVDASKEHGWKGYTVAMLVFSAVGVLFSYAILRLQNILPLNPQGLPALSPALAFNTAVSFATNTNWQSYGGEITMSYFSQMVALTIHNFTSAAVGISIAAAFDHVTIGRDEVAAPVLERGDLVVCETCELRIPAAEISDPPPRSWRIR
ncbi:MAG: potassium-transporting ATPase subunit KdpA [Luteolibacter sp.]